jgi:hypothetical protein
LASVFSIVPAASSSASARMTVLLAENASTAATYWSTFAAVAAFQVLGLPALAGLDLRLAVVVSHAARMAGCSLLGL